MADTKGDTTIVAAEAAAAPAAAATSAAVPTGAAAPTATTTTDAAPHSPFSSPSSSSLSSPVPRKRKADADMRFRTVPLADPFFASLRLTPRDEARRVAAEGRKKCPQCSASRVLYCHTCAIPVGCPEGTIPTVALPHPIHVVKHAREQSAKSTAIHAKVIAPESVILHSFPDVPAFDPARTILVYPSADATPVKDIGTIDFDTVVFIDSTWSQCFSMLQHPHLKALRCVRMDEEVTHFWRTQHGKSNSHLATIEAIYHFTKQAFLARHQDTPYDGRYDNMLFLFTYMYELVQESYRNKSEKAIALSKLGRIGYVSKQDAAES